MINELARLSEAIKNTDVSVQSWHRKYKSIPKISATSPCVRLILLGGKLLRIEPISPDMGKQLRRFGSNQGFYPGMNLQPLFRLTDEQSKKKLQKVLQGKAEPDIGEIRPWCTESNWGTNFQKKYAVGAVDGQSKLSSLLSGEFEWAVLNTLSAETAYFSDPMLLFSELKREAFRLLERKTDCNLALRILFHAVSETKKKGEDFGLLLAFFDSQSLIDEGIPVASVKFTQELNRRLIEVDTRSEAHENTIPDAFGDEFVPFNEPMPDVKLAGGINVTLRTMFDGRPCQSRYGYFGSDSYPISKDKRTELASALNWIASEEHRNITWTNTDKNEILFVHPLVLPPKPLSCVRLFRRLNTSSGNVSFEEEAKAFMKAFYGLREQGDDSNADVIQIFILRKIDKARTKIVYTRMTDAHEIDRQSEFWNAGKSNLPTFWVNKPRTPFPLDVADTLNRFLRQDGSAVTDKLRPIPKYHGMELFFGATEQLSTDLSMLLRNMEAIAPLLGKCISVPDTENKIDFWHLQQSLALMGLLLLKLGIGKEKYMKEFAYLCGQLLKISDELHVMYCRAERKGDIPTRLIGGSMYMSFSSAPIESLGLLGERMNTYLSWAKRYYYRGIIENDVELWRVGWIMSLYERVSQPLYQIMAQGDVHRFTDEQKAQFFLGYISAFPKTAEPKSSDPTTDNIELGGNENE